MFRWKICRQEQLLWGDGLDILLFCNPPPPPTHGIPCQLLPTMNLWSEALGYLLHLGRSFPPHQKDLLLVSSVLPFFVIPPPPPPPLALSLYLSIGWVGGGGGGQFSKTIKLVNIKTPKHSISLGQCLPQFSKCIQLVNINTTQKGHPLCLSREQKTKQIILLKATTKPENEQQSQTELWTQN